MTFRSYTGEGLEAVTLLPLLLYSGILGLDIGPPSVGPFLVRLHAGFPSPLHTQLVGLIGLPGGVVFHRRSYVLLLILLLHCGSLVLPQ